MNQGTKQSCFCEKCKAACENKPGWFLPGEVEKAAGYLNISLLQLFQDKLAVDWWVDDPDIFLLSPAVVNGNTGKEFPASPRGVCVFLKDGLCEIHSVKPFECREMIHNEKDNGGHGRVGDAWRKKQDQIVELLGREPVSAAYTMFDMFG